MLIFDESGIDFVLIKCLKRCLCLLYRKGLLITALVVKVRERAATCLVDASHCKQVKEPEERFPHTTTDHS